MKTLVGGVAAARSAPLALMPYTAIACLVAGLIAAGALDARPVTAPAGGAFPTDIYFDLKHALGYAAGWVALGAVVVVGILVRSLAATATLWLGAHRERPFIATWRRVLRLTALAVPSFVPAATAYFAGVALRYAPFIWAGALLGFVPAVFLARRVVVVTTGGPGRAPSFGAFWLYGIFLAVLGVLLETAGEVGAPWAAGVILVAGPFHALFLLGWKAEAMGDVGTGSGRVALLVAVLAVAAFLAVSLRDRERDPEPAGGRTDGSLALVGGADSTSMTGALVGLNPRIFGFVPSEATLLSYRQSASYGMKDTRRDLREVAPVVSGRLAGMERPTFLLGHSQAAIVIDHIVRQGLPAPDRAVVVAAPPSVPPKLEVPVPGEGGRGIGGATLARGLRELFEAAGLPSFGIDAPAGPTRSVDSSETDPDFPRLSIWALGDSVWLDGDWRRMGEGNVVALSDHVGTVRNQRAVEASRRFFAGRRVHGDERSWRGALVRVVRALFEPWRP